MQPKRNTRFTRELSTEHHACLSDLFTNLKHSTLENNDCPGDVNVRIRRNQLITFGRARAGIPYG